jgi:hypothetical protein
MHRDMSFDLDGIFSTRNAGELTSVKQVRTRVTRAPGLERAHRADGGDVTVLTPAIGRKMHASAPRPILRFPAKPLDASAGRSLTTPFYHRPGDLAGLGDVTLPVIGTVSTISLALAAVLGYVGYKMLKKA